MCTFLLVLKKWRTTRKTYIAVGHTCVTLSPKQNICMFGVRRNNVESFVGHLKPPFDKRSNASGSDSNLMSFGKIIGMQKNNLAMIQFRSKFVWLCCLSLGHRLSIMSTRASFVFSEFPIKVWWFSLVTPSSSTNTNWPPRSPIIKGRFTIK